MTPLRSRSLEAALFVSALAFMAPAAAWDGGCKHSAERRASVDAAGATRAVIVSRAGDLEVRPAQGSLIESAGEACASREEYLRELQVVARRDGTVVYIEAGAPAELRGFGMMYAYLDMSVSVPAGLPVEIEDSSGDIEAHDVRVVKVQDSSGDVVLRSPGADVAINDSSGDILVTRAAGQVQVWDSSGDIVIDGAREVVIPSDSSGDISVANVSGDVRIDRDSSGDIRIADVGRNVQLLSDTSGEVKVDRVQGTVQLP
jgi:hypothetical protein